MKVENIHQRIINAPINTISECLKTLATENDTIWPKEKWPSIRFKEGLKVGSKGGHGPIRYTIEVYEPNEIIQFRFSNPKDFKGIHKFEITATNASQTIIKHTINMTVKGKGVLLWYFTILHLHNALIEDAFDKVENQFDIVKQPATWNIWVRVLRKLLS
jgi:hypothetical protein